MIVSIERYWKIKHTAIFSSKIEIFISFVTGETSQKTEDRNLASAYTSKSRLNKKMLNLSNGYTQDFICDSCFVQGPVVQSLIEYADSECFHF